MSAWEVNSFSLPGTSVFESIDVPWPKRERKNKISAQSWIVSEKIKSLSNHLTFLMALPNIEMRRRVFSSGESPEISSWLDTKDRLFYVLTLFICLSQVTMMTNTRQVA